MLACLTGPVPGGLRIAWMRPSAAVTYCRAGAFLDADGAARSKRASLWTW
jgi:hypothetical protein